MSVQLITQPEEKIEAWVKLLPKGLVTIPKIMRNKLNFQRGEVVKMKLIGKRLVIEPREIADYEIYTDEELNKILEEDKLPKSQALKTASYWKKQNMP